MRKCVASNLFVVPLVGVAIAFSTLAATAQTAKDLVGSWDVVSAVNTAKDSTKSEVFGPNPKGMLMFGSDGRFMQIFTRPGLPKFAADNRLQGTPDENKAIVQGSIATFGTYSVVNKVLILHVEGSTWPSWTGTDQKRPLTSYTKGQFAWTLDASVGGTNVTTFKRLK
jgi:hypothetical protein